jgi:hypothetical protein
VFSHIDVPANGVGGGGRKDVYKSLLTSPPSPASTVWDPTGSTTYSVRIQHGHRGRRRWTQSSMMSLPDITAAHTIKRQASLGEGPSMDRKRARVEKRAPYQQRRMTGCSIHRPSPNHSSQRSRVIPPLSTLRMHLAGGPHLVLLWMNETSSARCDSEDGKDGRNWSLEGTSIRACPCWIAALASGVKGQHIQQPTTHGENVQQLEKERTKFF